MSTLRVNNMTNVGGVGPTYASGHVIQVVSFSSTTSWNTTSTTWAATNLAATITPKSTNSKIVVSVTSSIYSTTAAKNNWWTVFRGTTSGTNLGDATYGMGLFYSGSGDQSSAFAVTVYDSPATVAAITYTLAVKVVSGGNIYLPLNPSVSTIILMEVAA